MYFMNKGISFLSYWNLHTKKFFLLKHAIKQNPLRLYCIEMMFLQQHWIQNTNIQQVSKNLKHQSLTCSPLARQFRWNQASLWLQTAGMPAPSLQRITKTFGTKQRRFTLFQWNTFLTFHFQEHKMYLLPKWESVVFILCVIYTGGNNYHTARRPGFYEYKVYRYLWNLAAF